MQARAPSLVQQRHGCWPTGVLVGAAASVPRSTSVGARAYIELLCRLAGCAFILKH